MTPEKRARLILSLKEDPIRAHRFFFEGKHPFASAPFHDELIVDWRSRSRYAVQKAFRGAAKSTKAEESIALMACFREFKNCVVIKASETRAKEALTAIKAIYSTNDRLIDVFGDMLGPVISETKLVLSNGLAIQAAGKRQSLRGMKHNQSRPDLLFGDDMEDEEDVKTPEAHRKFMKWLYAEVLPSLQEPFHRVRIVGTPLADKDQCMIEKLLVSPLWEKRVIPIRYYDKDGELKPAWPQLFPLAKISAIEEEYRRAGRYETFAREYLVEGSPSEGQTFDGSMFSVRPQARTWQAVYAAIDPARTTSAQAAFTGWAVWSFSGSRIHIWEADGAHIAPDEIIAKVFTLTDKYNPVFIGIEKDGLELFLMQPLRAEMLRRGMILPLKELRAPRDKGKVAFIEGLQPFAKSGEITLNEPMDELVAQFLSFPKGRNDTINALAYSLLMRTGIPVYDFSEASIDEDLQANTQAPIYVLFNSNGGYVSAVICQYVHGRLNILFDYLVEGSPIEVFPSLYSRVNLDARLAANQRVPVKFVAPPVHFAPRDLIGLKAASVRAGVTLGQGGLPVKGQVRLQEMLRQTIYGRAGVLVNPVGARYTVRAFAGGYYKAALSDGSLSSIIENNIYSLPMESLESFAAATMGYERDEDKNLKYAVSMDGRTYLTSRRNG